MPTGPLLVEERPGVTPALGLSSPFTHSVDFCRAVGMKIQPDQEHLLTTHTAPVLMLWRVPDPATWEESDYATPLKVLDESIDTEVPVQLLLPGWVDLETLEDQPYHFQGDANEVPNIAVAWVLPQLCWEEHDDYDAVTNAALWDVWPCSETDSMEVFNAAHEAWTNSDVLPLLFEDADAREEYWDELKNCDGTVRAFRLDQHLPPGPDAVRRYLRRQSARNWMKVPALYDATERAVAEKVRGQLSPWA